MAYSLERLRALAARVDAHQADMAARDLEVRAAYRAGVPVAIIADAARCSAPRIYQLLGEAT